MATNNYVHSFMYITITIATTEIQLETDENIMRKWCLNNEE